MGSVPLAIFFYYKTIDGKYEKVKKDLISLFSRYIGTGNKLSLFYISSVINAKLRENNLKIDCITTNSIIEDLIVEVLSNEELDDTAERRRKIAEALRNGEPVVVETRKG